jgi:hypothetical protein
MPRSRASRRVPKLVGLFLVALSTLYCGSDCNSDDPLDVGGTRLEVVLDFTLSPEFEAGDTIRLARIARGRVADPDACIVDHLHTEDGFPGILIDGEGPFTDPNPGQCGFGGVYEVD